MNLAEIHRSLEARGGPIQDDAQAHNDLIALIFRCDIKTAQNIVSRVNQKAGGISTDAIAILKTADPLTIANCILEELRSSLQGGH